MSIGNENWPRLSESLTDLRCPDACQSCGGDEGLEGWQEHDQEDRPEPIAVVLCHHCRLRLIEPHPRLYRQMDKWEPFPGAMQLCVDCKHRQRLRCTHPDLKVNGGPGLLLTFPRPDMVIVCPGGPQTLYHGPVSDCAGLEPTL